ncbi:MAG: hypothetical protein CL920_04575 [Deltaproteobacteria bacterium]|nr:hypothetical protein [Deltaproteobacteria bacterium]MBU47953.1 hypothetical protein [Deltaproteobacteria bacterium]
MNNLYKRSGQHFHFWQAWEYEGKVTFHWGIVGQRGEVREEEVGPSASADEIIDLEIDKRLSEGFTELPEEAFSSLSIQYAVEGWGEHGELDKRDEVEHELNECLGWTGNGSCDGGDIGSGTINLFCDVLDPVLATKTIVDSLTMAGLLPGVLIVLSGEDGCDVLWPENYEGSFSIVTPQEDSTSRDLTQDNILTITTLLRRLQEEGGTDNFVVFTAGKASNYYIQFAGAKNHSVLYAEAVSNEFLAPESALSQDQENVLCSRGWNEPSSESVNFHREWEAIDHEHRLGIAHEVMKTFRDVYGVGPEIPLSVDFGLE